jgi:hypothetical protein
LCCYYIHESRPGQTLSHIIVILQILIQMIIKPSQLVVRIDRELKSALFIWKIP